MFSILTESLKTPIGFITAIFSAILALSIVYLLRKYRKLMELKTLITKKVDYVDVDCNNRFSKAKVPQNLDYIIIGSGTSGLSSGATLSKLGKKVLVLEQHDRIGGCFHTFEEQGFEFDTGFHYIGNVKIFKSLFSLLGSKKIEWNTFDHYDTMVVGDDQIEFKAPAKDFFQNLKKKFPHMEKEIDLYNKLGRQCSKLSQGLVILSILPGFLKFFYKKYLQYKYSTIYAKSQKEVFQYIGLEKDHKLQCFLSACSGDLGTTTEQMPFTLHVGLLSHYYAHGSMYPKESTQAIIKSIASTIKSKGGELLTKAFVKDIIVENGKAVGVLLKGGQEIRAKKVISTMGIPNTIKAIPDEKYRWKCKYEYDSAFNCNSLFLGVDITGMDIKMPTHNVWEIPLQGSQEIKLYDDYVDVAENSDNIDDQLLFYTFSTAKQDNTKNLQAVQIIFYSKWDKVEKFRINEVQRKDGYKEYKQNLIDKVTERFLKRYPQFEGKIVYKDLGTPLTNETYYNRKTPYGLQLTVEKIYDTDFYLNHRTPVKNLFISGQDIAFPGFIGSVMGGLLTGVQVEGYL